jgi:uncharacterized protein YdhG (YjbR/CyaY superfamily)
VAPTFRTVDEYIASFPDDVQEQLQGVRRAMRAAAPGTDEAISYGIPTLVLDGRYLMYFAGWKRHISVYPIPAVDAKLDKEIERYRAGKGTLRFPLTEPIPYELIGRLVATAMQNRARSG